LLKSLFILVNSNLKSLLTFLESSAQHEALEYGTEPKDEVAYPPFIKKLAKEVELLDRKVQKAYEEGDPNATELDVLFAMKQEQLETALSELEDEPKETDFEDEFQSGGQEEMMRQFASIYRHWHEKIPYQGVMLDKQQLLEFLRAWARDYGFRLGGFKEETTDEQLLDAAKDSYERMKYLINKKQVVEHKALNLESLLSVLEQAELEACLDE